MFVVLVLEDVNGPVLVDGEGNIIPEFSVGIPGDTSIIQILDFYVGQRNSERIARDIPDCPSAILDWFNVGEPCDCDACIIREEAPRLARLFPLAASNHFWDGGP